MNGSAAPSAEEVGLLVAAGRIDRLLAHARAARGPSMRRWLVDALEQALPVADPGSVSAAQRDEAIALGVDPSIADVAYVAPPPHAVLVPFAARAGREGLVRMVWVHWHATGDLAGDGVLGDDSREAVRRALALAERFARPAGDRGRYGLSAAQPAALARLRVEGTSIAAAAFVSAVALWSPRRRVAPGTVVTGELTATGVTAVGGLAAKLEACLHGRADVRRIVVPSRNLASVRAMVRDLRGDVEVLGVGTLDSLLAATLEEHTGVVDRPDDAVADARRAFDRGWQGWRWPAQREPLERLAGEIPDGRPDLRVETLTMLGAVTRHLGAPDESLAVLEQALAVVESEDGRDAVPDLPLTELYQHLAMTLRQLGRFGEASRMAARAVAVARRGRLRGELLEAHGCAGLVQLSRGRGAQAVKHQRAALELVHRHRPGSCPRTHGYLVEALGLAGELEEAREEYRTGLAHLRQRPEGPSRDTREAWLRTSFASALATHERWDEVRRILDAECVHGSIARDPLPGLVARRWLGLARAASRRPERGWELLAASPAAHGRGLLPHVRFLAHLNVLHELRSRLARDAVTRDAAERARLALDRLPRYADGLLGPHARRVSRALDAGARAPALGRDLDRLLARSRAIA